MSPFVWVQDGPLLRCYFQNNPSHASTLLAFFFFSIFLFMHLHSLTLQQQQRICTKLLDKFIHLKVSESNSFSVKVSRFLVSFLLIWDVIDFCFIQLFRSWNKNSSFVLCHHPSHSGICSTSGVIFKFWRRCALLFISSSFPFCLRFLLLFFVHPFFISCGPDAALTASQSIQCVCVCVPVCVCVCVHQCGRKRERLKGKQWRMVWAAAILLNLQYHVVSPHSKYLHD